MSSVKDEMKRIIQEQPDDSSFDEILSELALARMIDRGLRDSEAGRSVSDWMPQSSFNRDDFRSAGLAQTTWLPAVALPDSPHGAARGACVV